MNTKYIILCKASNEHFTFESLKELMDFLNPEAELQDAKYHEDLEIYEVAKQLKPTPQAFEKREIVKAWMLRPVT